MRSFHLLYSLSTASAFNFLPDIFLRHKRQACQVYTIIQYPCAVQTWVPTNTVLWVDACSTTLNVSNAPTSLSTTITSTTTLGIPSTSTSTKTVVVQLKTTSTLSTTVTIPDSVQNTSTSSPTISTTSPDTSGCIPSSTAYPAAEDIPANTTWIIQVTSLQITTQLNGVPVHLTREGGINYNTNLAVQVFFYDGILFALDTIFGVGWYGTTTFAGETAFALEQYSSSSPDPFARTFSTLPTSPLQLVWSNCLFENMNVIWALNVQDGLVHSWFSGTPNPPGNVEIVTLALKPAPAATSASSSSSSMVSTSTAYV